SDADEIISLINRAIMDDPSTSLTEGNIIRDGYNAELDRWRQMHGNFNKVLDDYIEEEKEATGIQNLRIKKSGNMGYFIEVTKGKLDMVPSHFIIRRSLVNAERYTTEKLRALEQNLNESGGRILEMERDLFLEVRDTLKKYVPFLQKLSREIAYTDVSVSFAAAAVKFGWTRPYLRDDSAFIVRKGRHPSVEAHLPSGEFIPNDLELSSDDKKTFALITGPNMAGKSTFLRQNAIIALLCQSGSFVPAESASLSVCDRIFCRVGASDNLARGESTFLVEMTETARILRNATERSLVIMDEVGRGTGTEDGLSIARAVSEYLLNRIKCKTLFATHYHELTRMDSPFMKKLCMDVLEDGKSVVFLRKVKEGSSENSFGLYVARLAGLPSCVVDRASLILQDLKKDGENITSLPEETYENAAEEEQKTPVVKESLTGALFSDEELILDEILSADVNLMTPMEALQKIMRWKSTLNNS
ncbi:MAG: DNA mismatch repair protein MutS, partial [Treponema sp.]|nr:DNA mismatch repair protein MutS [Treponema sp.]